MGLFSRRRIPKLNPLRDELLQELEGLLARFTKALDGDEGEQKGILGRAGSLVEAQRSRLEAFGALDLEQQLDDPFDQEEALQALAGAQHVPQLVQSFAAIAKEDGRPLQLEALATEASALALRLEGVIHLWVLKNGGLEGLLEL